MRADVGVLGLSAIGFSHDGKQVYAVTAAADVLVFDRATGKRLRSFALDPKEKTFRWARLLPGGRQVVAAHMGRLKVWDLTKGECVSDVATSLVPFTDELIDVRPDGKRLLTGRRGYVREPSAEPGRTPDWATPRPADTLTEWDVSTGKVTRSLGKGECAFFFLGGYLADGQSAWFQDEKGTVFWDLVAGRRKPILLEKFYGQVAFSADGKRMATLDVEGIRPSSR